MIRGRNRLISGVTQLDAVNRVSFNGAVSATGLVAYYKLDETSGTTANDSLGSYNGAITGVTINQTGKINKCYSFDGNSDYITLSDILSGASAFSFNAWITKSSVGAGTGLIYFKNDCLMCGNYDSSPYFRFRVRNSSGTWGATADLEYPYSADTWHMVTGTFENNGQSNNLKLYMDGSLWSQGTLASGNVQSGSAFTIGGRTNEWWNGNIDEVGIWSRVLTADEISILYNSGNGLTY